MTTATYTAALATLWITWLVTNNDISIMTPQ